jgi:hypothetical protein
MGRRRPVVFKIVLRGVLSFETFVARTIGTHTIWVSLASSKTELSNNKES